jgi:hypothetical protein
MEKNKPTRPSNTDPNKQVHSEFENTEGNSFEVTREEEPRKKKKEGDANLDEPLNELPADEGSVKNKRAEGGDPAKMDTGEKES